LFAVEEDMLDDACGFEEFECAVDGGFGDGVVLFFECVEELVGFEEAFECDDGVEDLGPFGGVFEAFGLEGAAEDGAEWFDELWLVGCGVRWLDGLEGHVLFYAAAGAAMMNTMDRCDSCGGLW